MNGNEYYNNIYLAKIENQIDKITNDEYKNLVIGFNRYMVTEGSMTRTRDNYIKTVVVFLNDIDKPLKEIGFTDYVNYLSKYTDKTSSYQVQIYTALKKFSNYIYTSEYTLVDGMKSVKRPKTVESIQTKQKRDNNYLTQEEMEKYLNNVKYKKTDNNVRDWFLIQLMLNTGLRLSAIAKIDLEDIDEKKQILKVVEKRGKIRTCIFSDSLMETYEKWIKERKEKYNPVDSALFVTKEGTRLTPKAIDKIVRKYGRGVKDIEITPHKLRATYGTMIYEKTGDIYLTKQCMGHSDIHTTMLYIRGQEEKAQKKAAEIMSNLTF